MSKCSSNDKARRVDRRVRLTERRDHAVAATFGGAQMDEQHLVFVVVDDARQFGPASNQVSRA